MMVIPQPNFPEHLLHSLLFNYNCDTWGTLLDIKHFIPRIIEIIFERYTNLQEFSVLLERGKWQEWPLDEQQIIDACVTEIWDRHWLSSDDIWDVFLDSSYDCLEGFLISHGDSHRLAELVFQQKKFGAAKMAVLIKKMDPCRYWNKNALSRLQSWLESGQPIQIMAQINDNDYQEFFMPTKEDVKQAISFLQKLQQ